MVNKCFSKKMLLLACATCELSQVGNAKCNPSEASYHYEVVEILNKTEPVQIKFVCEEMKSVPCSNGKTQVSKTLIAQHTQLDRIPNVCVSDQASDYRVMVKERRELESCGYEVIEISSYIQVQAYSDWLQVRVPQNLAEILEADIANLSCVSSLVSLPNP